MLRENLCSEGDVGISDVVRIGKKAAGRELDGKVWDQWPWSVIEGQT
ncbi:phage Gp37/Gp68 family protein [Patescibacteria group bacterium]|nr:phage Gp37/Gp68 family protein [Patescibacteria group bacterium]